MNNEQGRDPRFPRLPLAFTPRARLELEMVVLDEDTADARDFLAAQGIEVDEESDPLAVCKEWLKRLREAEQGKLSIRYNDKGPTMDLS